MNSNMPRWSILYKVLLRPANALFIAAGILVSVLPAMQAFWPEVYRSRLTIFSILILIMVTVGVISLCRVWFLEKQSLLESEHYLILVTLAVYMFMLFGALNYVLYLQNQEAFFVDRSLRETFYSKMHSERVKKLSMSRRKVEIWNDLASRTANLPQESFTKSKMGAFWSPSKYQIALPIEGWKVTISYVPPLMGSPGAPTPPVYRLNVIVGKECVEISSETHIDLKSDLMLLRDSDPLPKDDLVRVFRSAAEWEYKRWVRPLEQEIAVEKEDITLPLSLFLFQGAMDGLGSSPKYFIAAAGMTRCVAFFAAFLRYMFFGLFVSLLSKQWAKASNTLTKDK